MPKSSSSNTAYRHLYSKPSGLITSYLAHVKFCFFPVFFIIRHFYAKTKIWCLIIHDRCPMYPQIIFICIRNKKLKLNTDEFEPMKHFHFYALRFDSLQGAGLTTGRSIGTISFFCLQRYRKCFALDLS